MSQDSVREKSKIEVALVKIEVALVKGVEGNSIYLNNHRICGNKPWGGGQVLHTWETDIHQIMRAINIPISADDISKVLKKSYYDNCSLTGDKLWDVLAQSIHDEIKGRLGVRR